jgi:hypothetical protein
VLELRIIISVLTESSVAWGTTPCRLLKVSQCFGGTCHFHLQGSQISQARNKHEAGHNRLCLLLVNAGFLLGLFVNPEDGDHMVF